MKITATASALSLVFISGLLASVSPAADFYVSTIGNDAWSGTFAVPQNSLNDGPFATLQRARDAVRKFRKEKPTADITVHIRGGIYELARPLELNSEDSGSKESPVVWTSSQNERVVLSGGRKIQGFRPVIDEVILNRLPEVARTKVLQADLKSSGVSDYGEVATEGNRAELFWNSRPMTLSRWPNDSFSQVDRVLGEQPISSHGIKGDAVGKIVYSEDRPSRWMDESDVWLCGYWFWDWSDGCQRVKAIDPAKRVIELAEPHHHYGYRKGQRFFAFNVLAELDRPGEWYLDRSQSTLYFWPPSETPSEPALSVLPTVVAMKNASWVQMHGLVLEDTRATAVTIEGGEGVRVSSCLIRNTGGWGVTIMGGRNHGVLGCDVEQTGEGGLLLDGGDRLKLLPAGHFAENNHVHHYARLVRTYRPAVGIQGVGNRAVHNLIHDAPHTAILLGGNDHLIEFNEIHHVCEETGDVGAFYMGRDWTMRGNLIRHNFFHELNGPGMYGAMAVYLDDAASGTTVFGNVFYRAARSAFIGGGRDNLVENNVFVDCRPAVHVDARGLGWMHETVAPQGVMRERLAAMPYQLPPWSTRYPELVRLLDENPAAPQGNRVVRNISVGGNWLNLEKDAKAGVAFEDNLVGQDPRFVDADALNFALRDDSPAWGLGFKKIPIEQIGLVDDEWRRGCPGTEVRVAAISFVPEKFGVEANVRRLQRAFRDAKASGAELAVAPEGAIEGYVVNEIIRGDESPDRMRAVAQAIDSPVIQSFQRLARELKMCLVFGFAELSGDDVFNCAVFIDQQGVICGRHHKMQLAEGYDEAWWFNRLGKKCRAFNTPFGRCGILICNDRWNPHLARISVLDGTQFLLIPSYGSTGKSQDDAVLARGRENNVPVVEANVGVTLVVNGNNLAAVDRHQEGITFGTIVVPPSASRDVAARDQMESDFLLQRRDEMKRRLERTRAKLNAELKATDRNDSPSGK